MNKLTEKLRKAVTSPESMLDPSYVKREKVKQELQERQAKQYQEGMASGVVDPSWETTQSYSTSDVSAITPEKRKEIKRKVGHPQGDYHYFSFVRP